MNASTEEKKVQRTNPATPHFLKIEVIIPDSMIPEEKATAVTLRPTRFVCFDAVEHRYVAYIRLKHPPFTGKIPLEMYHEIGLTYHVDEVIDQTTYRLILQDPVEEREVTDMTHDLDNVKIENEEESKDGQGQELRPYQNSHSPPPLERMVTLTLVLLEILTNTYLHIHTYT